MSVSLVAYIPNQLIVRGVVNVMQSNTQLHYTQAGCKMPAMNAYYVYNVLAQLIANLVQLLPAKLLEIVGGLYALKKGAGRYLHGRILHVKLGYFSGRQPLASIKHTIRGFCSTAKMGISARQKPILPLIPKRFTRPDQSRYLCFNMRIKKSTLYWCCQLGGWLFYGLSAVFFAIVFDNFDSRSYNILFRRIAISIFFGLLSTHLLRILIQRLKLYPPIDVKKWWMLTMTVVCVIILYSFANSATVEWLHVYYIWHYVELGSKNEIQKIRLESLVKELELKTIKSHINPHFIFNALNSIRALVDENPERARTAITELSNILRSSMQAEKMETVPLEKELNIVKDYLALEHIRFEDRLQVSYDIDEDTLDQPVPPMMLQTLVENAIKHGISKQKSGGVIRIVSDFRDHHHELVVQNSGHLQDASNTGEGFGLNSTRNRLKLLYGAKASFDIRDTPQAMVEAIVKMPLAQLHS
jgi:hypothetical protein